MFKAVTPTTVYCDILPESSACQLEYIERAKRLYVEQQARRYKWTRAQMNEKLMFHTKKLYQKIDKGRYQYAVRPGSLLHRNIKIEYAFPIPQLKEEQYIEPLPYTLYPYQTASADALLKARHGYVEMATGCGKSLIACELVRRSGLRACVVVPGKENCHSLYALFTRHFGASSVGMYGDGRKEARQKITICIAKALTQVTDAHAYKHFREKQILIVDESHTWASNTLSELCHGLFAFVPYRLFLSATQTRNTDEDPLLFSIIGACTYKLSTKDALQADYIDHHDFLIYKNVPSSSTPEGARQLATIRQTQPMQIRRCAFLLNSHIADIIAKDALSFADQRKATMVLVDQVEQIGILVNAMLAVREHTDLSELLLCIHGETNKDRLLHLGLAGLGKNKEWRTTSSLVDAFNRGERLILIATSCVQTGASFYTPHRCYNWVGGGMANNIRTCQGSVGRSVRKWSANPFVSQAESKPVVPKTKTTVVDFDVEDQQLQKHLAMRIEYYRASGTEIKEVVRPT